MNNKSKKLCKQYRKRRTRLKRIQREIVTQISEIIFPDLEPEVIKFMHSNNNPYAQRGKAGKWIDGSEMTPDKEKYLEQIANELYVKNTTPEQQEQLKRRFRDLNAVNNKLHPGPKKRINLDF